MGNMQNLYNHPYVQGYYLVSALIRNIVKTITRDESFTFRKYIQHADGILLRRLSQL
jgi:hypothetical protein